METQANPTKKQELMAAIGCMILSVFIGCIIGISIERDLHANCSTTITTEK